MKAQTKSVAPSDLLPSGFADAVTRTWDSVGEALSWPSQALRLTSTRHSFLRLSLDILVFGALFLPAVLSLHWPGHFEAYRQSFMAAAPASVAAYLTDPIVSAVSLIIAYILVFSINRAWSANEREREAIAFSASDKRADDLADLRADGLVSALLYIPLLPLLFLSANAFSCMRSSECLFLGENSLQAWVTYLVGSIFAGLLPSHSIWQPVLPLSAHGPLAPFLLWLAFVLPCVLVLAFFEVHRAGRVISLALNALAQTEDRAVAVGSRILLRLRRIIEHDDERAELPPDLFEHAAIALGRIASQNTLLNLFEIAAHQNKVVKKRGLRAVQARIEALSLGAQQNARSKSGAVAYLKHCARQESDRDVVNEINRAVEGIKRINAVEN